MLYLVVVAAVAAGIAAWTDARTGNIPNWLTFGLLGGAIVFHVFYGIHHDGWRGGLWGLGYSIGGAALCALAPMIMYWQGAIGGGDIKLFAALGALCLPMIGIEVEMYAFVAAALIAPAQLAYKGVLLRTLRQTFTLVSNPFRKRENRQEIPEEMKTWFRLGPAIFLGAAASVLTHLGDLP
jgi:prepilin peptidase CpaA